MTRGQIILIGFSVAALVGIYVGVPNVNPKKNTAAVAAQPTVHQHNSEQEFLETFSTQLSPNQKNYLASLQNQMPKASSQDSAKLFGQMAAFWKDSANVPPLYLYYAAQKAELDNTEKNLTFAAHLILGYLPYANNEQEQVWLAKEGNKLFERALIINPSNDSSKIGLGGTVMFGAGEPGKTMEGIMKVREVVERDSNNLFGQYMLGIGGMNSGQFDKAAMRFEKVAKASKGNVEAMFKAAEAFEQAGNKAKAIEWYQHILLHVSEPQLKQAVLDRIKQLNIGETPNK